MSGPVPMRPGGTGPFHITEGESMSEWVIWGMVALVSIPSILVIIWPLTRYKNVTRKEAEKQ